MEPFNRRAIMGHARREIKALWVERETIYCITCGSEVGRMLTDWSPGEPLDESTVRIGSDSKYFDLCPDCGKQWQQDFRIGRKRYAY